MLKRRLFRRMEGEAQLRRTFAMLYGKELDTSSPVTFSEKLFTRMILINRHGSPRLTRLSDKFLAREYVREKVGEKYLVKLLWKGTNPKDIPFGELPSKCLAKTNHGSGGNIVLSDPVNREKVIKQLREQIKENYYWSCCEYQYYKIHRRILVEEFLDDGELDGPLDYRFWCFHGQPEVIQVDNHLHDINPFYDLNWSKLPVSYRDRFRDRDIKKPDNFQEMLAVASELSSDFDFVRVDLYNRSGKICFGELTFTPVAGKFTFKPQSWNALLGRKWNFLPEGYLNRTTEPNGR